MHGMNGNASKPCQKPATFAGCDSAGLDLGGMDSNDVHFRCDQKTARTSLILDGWKSKEFKPLSLSR